MYNLEIINRVGGATSIRIHESYINSTLSFNPLNSKVSLSKSSISPFPINFKREETIRLSKEEIHISKNRGVAVSHSWGGGGAQSSFRRRLSIRLSPRNATKPSIPRVSPFRHGTSRQRVPEASLRYRIGDRVGAITIPIERKSETSETRTSSTLA